MRAEDDELVGLLAAAKLGNHVRCLIGRTRPMVGIERSGPNGMSGGEQTGDAFRPSARAIMTIGMRSNSSSHGVRVTVKEGRVTQRGHEYDDRTAFHLDRANE